MADHATAATLPPPGRSSVEAPPVAPHVQVRSLTAWYGAVAGVRDIALEFPRATVTALIGPSGCGKSTLLRTLNRLHEEIPDARIDGGVMLDGVDIYGPGISAMRVRRKVGMVFQKPTPFPAMTVAENAAAGLRVGPPLSRREREAIVERALRGAALWEEVKDRLHHSALELSGGQQQRLCVARAIAPEPEVLLLDEPTAALDPIATARIEELVHELKRDYTIIIVTHNMQQAARVSDVTAFLYLGTLVETGPTPVMFTAPANPQTEAYVTGRFG
jgi:phosphate transport system ATP-binding protein